VHVPAICLAPQYLAEELLRLEGFSEVEYVEMSADPARVVYSGHADFSQDTAPTLLPAVDAGKPIVALAGVQVGCFELIAHERVRAIRDLKGKTVVITTVESAEHLLLASMLAYVGMDPAKDIRWLAGQTYAAALDLFVAHKADAIMGWAPQPQELRARGIGHVIVNTATDRPWSQYFCCMVIGHREFTARYPVATKRAIRAFLKAADICARQPQQGAQLLAEKGFEPRYEIALEVLRDLPYDRWRTDNPEDTLRFHALRLHEVGMIQSTPQQIIARGTDWRFLNELKRELKA
jgi:NitT/TauT family transport system substrate-binding protein